MMMVNIQSNKIDSKGKELGATFNLSDRVGTTQHIHGQR
jgi:hypothetical protein